MSTAAIVRQGYRDCTKDAPCQICGKDRFCGRNERWLKCRNDELPHADARKSGCDELGLYWLHLSPDAPPDASDRGRGREQRATAPAPRKAAKPKADADKLNAVYFLMLNNMRLSRKWQNNLRSRGLSFGAIARNGYRALPSKADQVAIQKRLIKTMPDAADTVPGIAPDRPFGRPGQLIVPVRDLYGRIVGLKLRRDGNGQGPKYYWLSSARHGGPGPGNPVHVPLGTPATCDMVRATEGELKSDAAFHISKVPTISCPGVQSWKSLLPAIAAMQAKTVVIAFDADASAKPAVAAAQLDLLQELQRQGYAIAVERWPVDEAGEPKGIDDCLSRGRQEKIETLYGDDAIEHARACVATAGATTAEGEAAGAIETAGAIEAAGAAGQILEATNDPDRLARTFLTAAKREDRRLVFWRGDFYQFIGYGYRQVPSGEVQKLAGDHCKHEFDKAAREKHEEDKRKNPKAEPATPLKVTRSLLNDVLAAVQRQAYLSSSNSSPCWLDGPGPFPANEIMATKNGLLHLPSWADKSMDAYLEPTDQFFTTYQIPHAIDPVATCPRWEQFLDEVFGDDKESRELLQAWFGYLLLPDVSQQKILWWVSPPRGGKGTCCFVIKNLLGHEAVVSPELSALAERFGLQSLLGKTVAIVPEAEISRPDEIGVAVSRLKSISGGDSITIDIKFREPLPSVSLPLRFMLVSNSLPALRDASGALKNRILLIESKRSFLGREDTGLAHKLATEAPGILLWAMVGYARLRAVGRFVQPASGLHRLEQWSSDANPTRRFLDECCEFRPEYTCPRKNVFHAWQSWCLSNNHRPGNAGGFCEQLRSARPELVEYRPTKTAPWSWRGMRLTSETGGGWA